MQETPHKGADTREHILDVAEASVLDKGFDATSIEEVIAAVGITKSGFFYHLKDKNELAKAMLIRYVEREDALFDELFARADELNDDPLHGFLVGLRMMSELMADLPNGLAVSSPPIAIRIASSTKRCARSTRPRCSIGEKGFGSAWT